MPNGSLAFPFVVISIIIRSFHISIHPYNQPQTSQGGVGGDCKSIGHIQDSFHIPFTKLGIGLFVQSTNNNNNNNVVSYEIGSCAEKFCTVVYNVYNVEQSKQPQDFT